MVDAMSFSTTAAALQNEMNVNAIVVATSTLARVAFCIDLDGFIALEARFNFHGTAAARLCTVKINKNHLMAVPLQQLS